MLLKPTASFLVVDFPRPSRRAAGLSGGQLPQGDQLAIDGCTQLQWIANLFTVEYSEGGSV